MDGENSEAAPGFIDDISSFARVAEFFPRKSENIFYLRAVVGQVLFRF
jgi:hypothetical protein